MTFQIRNLQKQLFHFNKTSYHVYISITFFLLLWVIFWYVALPLAIENSLTAQQTLPDLIVLTNGKFISYTVSKNVYWNNMYSKEPSIKSSKTSLLKHPAQYLRHVMIKCCSVNTQPSYKNFCTARLALQTNGSVSPTHTSVRCCFRYCCWCCYCFYCFGCYWKW